MDSNTRMKRILILLSIIILSFTGTSRADDAVVLPKGTWRLLVDSNFFLPITQRYNKNGQVEDIAKDFNVVVDDSIFPPLSGLNPFVPGGKANLGRTETSFRWMIKEMTIQPAYGLTDKLSIGMNIPYKWMKNNVKFNLNTTNANVCKSNLAGSLVPCGSGLPDEAKVTTQDVQAALGPGIPSLGIQGFGFKPIESFQDDGFGDIQVGGKYQYFTSPHWRLAFTGGVQIPTGKIDDPNNLVDRGFGTGAYALLFWFNQDFLPKPASELGKLGIPEAGSFFVNTTVRYSYYLPDKQNLRVCNVNAPICPSTDDVRRKLGDVIDAELSGSYGITKSLYFSPMFKYGHSFQDHYAGDKPLDYGTLTDQTDYTEYVYKISLSYTTLPAFEEGTFPIPIIASISYRDRFAGNDNTFKSRYIGLTISAYF